MLLLDDIVNATGGRIISKGSDTFASISIDSRTIKDGELFLCLRGQRFNGHDFLRESLKIARGAIIDEPGRFEDSFKNKTIILVQDTLRALQAIATYLRKKSIKNLIAITGSNGKTTTKELLWQILSIRGSAIKNEGNLNNEIGLPLSIINNVSRYGDVDYGVFEMGASRPGDIRVLCEIARPDYGVITNIGHAHLDGMGGIEGVFRTKAEMADFVKVLFINGDDRYLERLKTWAGCEIVTFGLGKDCPVRAEDIRLEDTGCRYTLIAALQTLSSKGLSAKTDMRLGIPGMGNLYNSLAGAAVSLYLDLSLDTVKEGLENFRGVKLRLEIKDIDGVNFIVDAYNANPDSMKNAIKELMRLKNKRAIAVLGDMLELGPYSEELHRELGRLLNSEGVDIFLAVGPEMKKAAEEAKGIEVHSLETAEEAGRLLSVILRHGDTVLIKGSRLMAMERVMDIVKKPFEPFEQFEQFKRRQ